MASGSSSCALSAASATAGAVLRPALIWCDTRTQPECDWLTAEIGYERLIELHKELLYMWQKSYAQFGKGYSATGAVEKLAATLLFQRAELTADDRLCGVCSNRGLRQAAVLSDLDKQLELLGVHKVSL